MTVGKHCGKDVWLTLLKSLYPTSWDSTKQRKMNCSNQLVFSSFLFHLVQCLCLKDTIAHILGDFFFLLVNPVWKFTDALKAVS